MPRWLRWITLVALGVLSACATYHAKPLPGGPDLASAAALAMPVKKLRIPGLRKPHVFNAADGLNRIEVVTLAVINNPRLKAARLQAGVAGAQLIQAGVLPNPQLSADFIAPFAGPPPLFNGYQLGLMQDLTALIARGAATTSAKSHVQEVNLNILWQEWQVAQQARQLFVQARAQARLRQVLQSQQELSQKNYRRDKRALRQGNATLPAVAADLVVLMNTNTQLRQLARTRNNTRHSLTALLGLEPAIHPVLVETGAPRTFSKTDLQSAIARLPYRRPDLLALRAGYQSQQAAVRRAILQQFPQLSIGPTQGSDTSKVRTAGFGITLSLPLFDRNQGQIAIARATRAVLRQSYQARLDQAVNQAHQVWRETELLAHQLQQLRIRLPALTKAADAAERAFSKGDVSAGTYINLRSSLLSKREEAIRLKASLAQSQATLETLLGMTLDPRDFIAGRGES